MGAIRVHEFISLDSVIDTPSWTFQFGFDPRMGEAIGRITTASDGILLGRTTYETASRLRRRCSISRQRSST